MVKLSSLKFILPVLCTSTNLYSVVHKHQTDGQIVHQSIETFPRYLFKGIFPINNFGWYIKQKSEHPLEHVSINGDRFQVQYQISHPSLPFEIFKVDTGNQVSASKEDPTQNIATLQNSEEFGEWVTTLAFVRDRPLKAGYLSEELHDYAKSWTALSKIVERKDKNIVLSSGSTLEEAYEEIWSQLKLKIIGFYWKNFNDLNGLQNNKEYQNNHIQTHLEKETELVDTEINKITRKVSTYKQGKDKFGQFLNAVTPLCPDFPVQIIEEWYQEKRNKFDHHLDAKKKEKETILPQIWRSHVTQLKEQRKNILAQINELDDLSFFEPSSRQKIEVHIKNHLYTSLNGVAETEDKGGFILMITPDSTTPENKYNYKLVGITQDGDLEGEKSIALDLTTPEVQGWISKKINQYYNKAIISNALVHKVKEEEGTTNMFNPINLTDDNEEQTTDNFLDIDLNDPSDAVNQVVETAPSVNKADQEKEKQISINTKKRLSENTKPNDLKKARTMIEENEDPVFHMSDEIWKIIQPILARVTDTAIQDHRLFINDVFWVLGTNAKWIDLPNSSETYIQFFDWKKKNIWKEILQALQHEEEVAFIMEPRIYNRFFINLESNQTKSILSMSDKIWERIQPLLPIGRNTTPQATRLFVNKVFWVLNTACWSDLTDKYGRTDNTYNRFNDWKNKGIWELVAEEIKNENGYEFFKKNSNYLKK